MKQHGEVNGADGTVVSIALSPDEEADDGTGPYRNLSHPPTYIVFRPTIPMPTPSFTDGKTGAHVPAGCMILTPHTHQFKVRACASTRVVIARRRRRFVPDGDRV